ncbi:MAG: lysophospholipid acyltransferase family protein [Deltaproteobacteria bacterium]|nr:lysophospholipid acyltransferase family protein [Deltaproteobacteria bacterium]
MKKFRSLLFRNPLLVSLLYHFIRLYLSTCRLQVINEHPILNQLNGGCKVVAALWHQRFFGLIGYARKFCIYEPSAIISRSDDGEMIAQLALRLGFRPIRGSSTSGGRQALMAMVDDLAHNQVAAHAVDGPQGPRGLVKAGLIKIAQLSGAAIIPVYVSMNRAWRLNSWDRFLIPKPFSRIVLEWGDPIVVPPELDPDAFENFRLDVEGKMKNGHTKLDQSMGWENRL